MAAAHSRTTDVFFDELTTELLKLRVLAQQRFRTLSEAQLNRRPSPSRWSAGQCLEHLNIVGGHYLPEIRARLGRAQARGSQPAASVKHGFVGARLVARMRAPTTGLGGQLLTSPQRYAPTGHRLTRTVAEGFSRQLDELLRLTLLARQVNANTVRIPHPLLPLLRLRLTDTFEFLLAHIQRHLRQAEAVLANLPAESAPK